MPGATVIDVAGLVRCFGDFRAVDGVTFTVAEGEVFGFLGANGAGKTTTIRMLCGLLAPTAGEGRVLGFDLMRESERVKPHVGYMSQRFSLYADLSVAENLDFFGGIYGLDRRRLRARKQWAIAMAGLTGKEGRLTRTLAGGWKQRLALGAALLHEPRLLFLDEPTAGVSPEARREFWDLIHELGAAGTTVFVTSHYMDEVEHCDRVALMSRGAIAALDTPARLKRSTIAGELVRVRCSSPLAAAREALFADEAVRDVQPFGADLHVLVRSGAGGAELVRRSLARAGIACLAAEAVEPDLEDVFIAVIQGAKR